MSVDLGTNAEAASSGLAKAVDQARQLEHQADRTFEALTLAQERMREVGVNVDVVLSAGMAAAFSEWKRGRAAAEGAATAAGDWAAACSLTAAAGSSTTWGGNVSARPETSG